MAKLKLVEGTKGSYAFRCPGCKRIHVVTTKDEGYPHPIWDFNGDVEKPMFHPSVYCSTANGHFTEICHSFVTLGKIQFLDDCTHPLKGQMVDLPDIE